MTKGREQAWQPVELQEEQLGQASWHRKQVLPLRMCGGAHEEHPRYVQLEHYGHTSEQIKQEEEVELS